VLGLIPGLLERLPGVNVVGVQVNSLVQEMTLVRHDAFAEGGYAVRGIPRTQTHQYLVDTAQERGIPIHWGHKLVSFEENVDEVTAVFQNGSRFGGSFAVGCDGLHSGSRTTLFGREKPHYLGMTQVRPNAL
jgi:salicylate hydroxylase